MRYIKDLNEGNSISGIYYCKQKVSTETKAGKPYDNLILQDKTGILDTKVWDPNSPGIGEYSAGDFIDVHGEVIMFNNQKQAKLSRIRNANNDDFDQSDFFPVTKKDPEKMFQELLGFINSVKSPYYKKLLEMFFVEDNEFVKIFKQASAAKTVHHGFIGGLLEHTLSVTKLCDYYTTAYPMLNRDLLITAAICHDIAKTKEIACFPVNDYTDEGQLLGHIVLGSEMIAEKVKLIPDFPAKQANELKHCILAHHGEYEYGSPKKPALIEAVALNFADNTDAKLETLIELFDNTDSKEWLGFNKFLDSNVRKTTE